MKTLISSAVAAAFLFASSISADDNTKPIELSESQMDQINAGVGAQQGAGAGFAGWIGLGPAGFTFGDLNPNSQTPVGGVIVPGPKDAL